MLPRNCRAACQETRAGAEPDNFRAGDNFASEAEASPRRLSYPGAPRFPHRAQPPPKAPQIQGIRLGMTPSGPRWLRRSSCRPGQGAGGNSCGEDFSASALISAPSQAQFLPPSPLIPARKESACRNSFQLRWAVCLRAARAALLPLFGEISCPESGGRSSGGAPVPPRPRSLRAASPSFPPPKTHIFGAGGTRPGSDGSCRWKMAPELWDLLRPTLYPPIPQDWGLSLVPKCWETPRACACRPGSVPSPHLASP